MEIVQKLVALRALPPEQLLTHLNRQLPAWVAVALVLLLAWHGASLLWAVLPGAPEFNWNQPVVAELAPVATTGRQPGVDFGRIAAAHLFGEPDAEPPPAAAVKAPETRLNLKLRGTVAASDDSIAHAIIADGSNRANVYFVEDALPGGATLHEVFPDRVILKRGGAFETLRLPKKSEGGGAARSNTGLAARPPRTVTGGMPGGSARGAAGIDGFTEIIRPQPFMPNGELKGYRVYPGRDRRGFAALGLRPGDLVTDINGTRLDNIQSSMEVFRSLAESPQVTITVERNGTPMILQLDTSRFSNAAGARR